MDLLWLRRSREDTPASWGHPLPLRAAAARFSGVGGLRLRPAIQHAEGWGETWWVQRGFAGEKAERRGLGGSWPSSATGLSVKKKTEALLGSIRE